MINNITFSIENIWIVLLIVLPNILYIKYPPFDAVSNIHRPKWWIIVLTFEKIGQVGIMVLPLLWRFEVNTTYKWIVFCVLLLCLLLYYVCWIKYFANGRKFTILYEKLIFIPIPMAILPIVYFGCASYLLNSTILVLATILFAVGHISESLLVSRACRINYK